jgi:hypothetical protein
MAIAGNPGKYISMENGLIVEIVPKIRIITKCCRRVITLKPIRSVDAQSETNVPTAF